VASEGDEVHSETIESVARKIVVLVAIVGLAFGLSRLFVTSTGHVPVVSTTVPRTITNVTTSCGSVVNFHNHRYAVPAQAQMAAIEQVPCNRLRRALVQQTVLISIVTLVFLVAGFLLFRRGRHSTSLSRLNGTQGE
jgi:hypothetical protein